MFFPVSIVTAMLSQVKRFGVRKSILLLVLVPYLFLLGIFHSRLNTHVKSSDANAGDDNASTRAELTARHLQRAGSDQTDSQRVQQRQLQRAAASRLVSILQNDSLSMREKAELALRHVSSAEQFNTEPQDFDEINTERTWTVQLKDVRFPAAETEPSSQQRMESYFALSVCNASSPGEQSFQLLQNIYVYSAYYDDRRRNAPYVRVIALSPSRDQPQLFCHFIGRQNRTTAVSYYEMCENHSHRYGGWILSCPVPSVHSPSKTCTVTVSTSEDPADGGATINVRPITKMSRKRRFGVCVPPLFGNIPAVTLIQFIELSKLLGAEHFYFYAHDVTEDIRKVLQHHKRDGTVTVIPWTLPTRAVNKVWYHGQLVAINDCLYRGMSSFKYLAFNDIDEFIVPHRHFDWNTMLRDTQRDAQLAAAQCSGFSFQSAFFDQHVRADSDEDSPVGYDLASDLRTRAFSRIRSKVIVESRKIFELGIHHISKPIIDRYQPCMVSPKLAFVHHYRKCTSDFEPDMNCGAFKRDNATLRYAAKLTTNVKKVMTSLGL